MNFDHELDRKYSGDSRSDCFNDGYKPQVQPAFMNEVKPKHLMPKVPRGPMRNPNPPYRNPNPYKELRDIYKYIFKGEL